MDLTHTRILSTVLFDRLLLCSLFKKIVNFYYKRFTIHPNLFKFSEKMSINKTEHTNYLTFIKTVNSSSINYIY